MNGQLPARGSAAVSHTILLVDDEPMVRTVVRTVLETEGYVVVEATGGTQAIDLCTNFKGPIHLLLTDVLMRGMSGRQVAEAVVVRYPTIRVLFMSGKVDNAFLQYVGAGDIAFLQKPFTPTQLVQKVRDVLMGS